MKTTLILLITAGIAFGQDLSVSLHSRLLATELDFHSVFTQKTSEPAKVPPHLKEEIKNRSYEIHKEKNKYSISVSNIGSEQSPTHFYSFDGEKFYYYDYLTKVLRTGRDQDLFDRTISSAIRYFPPLIISAKTAECGQPLTSDNTKFTFFTPEKLFRIEVDILDEFDGHKLEERFIPRRMKVTYYFGDKFQSVDYAASEEYTVSTFKIIDKEDPDRSYSISQESAKRIIDLDVGTESRR